LGLTGTVLGILVAFDRFAASGGQGSTEVMVAISQALIATAAGLVVAIPAVVFYNILRNRNKTILEEGREIQALILAHVLHATFSPPEA
ncbi:MAG TPA: MotA/TolQ/ExbB proton channel family protein, partial [Steroidobacteraceae bacterium]|nr:MotA/TolQ/ExbB proton channel family protein [Steroidobacteraceae bacterium]